jgi:hypothetical protein
MLVCGYLLKQLETTFVVNHNFKISPSGRCVSDSNAICKGNRYFNKDYSSLTNILYLCVHLQVKFVLLSHILWVLCCTFDRLSSVNWYFFIFNLTFIFDYLSCTDVFVLDCNWPCLAAVNHANKWIQLKIICNIVLILNFSAWMYSVLENFIIIISLYIFLLALYLY